MSGQNNVPKDYLDGAEPVNVAGDTKLNDTLREKNAEFYQINLDQIRKRAINLKEAGHYRTLLNRTKFHRGWPPNWSDKVHTIANIDFDKVCDITGAVSLTKQALPVSTYTDVGPARQIEKGENLEL